MSGGPNLRAVPDSSSSVGTRRPERGPELPGDSRKVVLLSVALVIALVLLIWSRTQLGSRIEDLEAETAALREAVAERDVVIDAHKRRVDDVRARVDELRDLLLEPLPEAR